MVSRGQIFWPSGIFPPGQDTGHRAVVLTSNNLVGIAGAQFVLLAIIRSARNQSGRPTRVIPLHSIKLTPTDCPCLTHDSYLETHQLFSYPVAKLNTDRAEGTLPPDKLKEALAAAKLIFD